MRKTQNVKLFRYFQGSLAPVEIDAFFFPGGEPHVNRPENLGKGQKVDYVIRLYGGNFEDLALALTINNALRNWVDGKIYLFAPYFPAARQDKGLPFTLGIAASMINDAEFERVIVVDPHSDGVQSNVNSLLAIMPTTIVPKELFSYETMVGAYPVKFVVIAPDEGAKGRAEAVANLYRVPLVTARKKRDENNNFRVGAYEVDKFEADYAVVIDDICDGGGTFLALADAIKMPADRLRLWTTHGIYSKGTEALYQKYGVIASTDSLNHTSSIHYTVDLQPFLLQALGSIK